MKILLFLLLSTSIVLSNFTYAAEKLSREEAKEILDNSGKTYTSMSSPNSAILEGVELGFWDKKGRVSKVLTSTFEKVEQDGSRIIVRKPYKLQFTITGISDDNAAGTIKLVEFDWSRIGISPMTAYFGSKGGTGHTKFRLYDDGWRVSGDLEFKASKERHVKTSDVEQEINVARGKVAHLKESEEIVNDVIQRHAAKAAAEKKIRYKKATENNQVIKTFGATVSWGNKYRLEIGDKHLRQRSEDGKWDYLVWYGAIRDFLPNAPNKVRLTCRTKTFSTRQLYLQVPQDEHSTLEKVLSKAVNTWRNKYPEFAYSDWCDEKDVYAIEP